MDKQLKSVADAQLSLIGSYSRFFSDGDGQAVLYDLMNKGFFIKPTFDQNSELSARNEGRRELILYIIEMLNADSEKLMKFIEQQEKERTNYDDEDY